MEPLLESKDLPRIVSRFVVSRAPAMTQPSFCRLVRTGPRAEEEFGPVSAKNRLKLPKIWPERGALLTMEPLLESKVLPPIVSRFFVSRAPEMTQPTYCHLDALALEQRKNLAPVWPKTG